jgi:hypothetical protein
LGNGIVSVANTAGGHRAQAFADDAKETGHVEIYNDKPVAVASLYGGAEGDGQLTLADASGNIRVEAGVVGEGAVSCGPSQTCGISGVGFVGLVPSHDPRQVTAVAGTMK